MKAKVYIARGSDGTFDATMEYNKAIPFGLLGQGKTAKEAIEDFYNSYEEAKQMLAEEGKECPDVDFEFYNDVPSFLQQYAFILTLAGLVKVTGVSQTILSHYISGYRHPSPKTVKKIEEGIKNFSQELSSVKFA